MKLFSLLIVFGFLYMPARAQRDSLSQRFLTSKCGQLHLSLLTKRVTSEEKLPTNFGRFEVVDFRQDTSRIGFWMADKIRREFVFHGSANETISSFLNHYTDPSGTRSFLILIKKLWLYDTVLSTKSTKSFAQVGKGRILFRGEAFLKTSDGYLPYTYLDTVISSPTSVKDMAIFRLPDLFYDLLKKIAGVQQEITLKRKAFSFSELEALNNTQFNYPMDTARVLKKGVYASIEEFRNNNPTILNYEIQADENDLKQLYLKDGNGKTYFSRKMWGYCDGQQCYAMMDGNLFPVISVNHAFYVFGSRQYEKKGTAVPILFMLIPPVSMLAFEGVSETATRKLSFFTLDPHTGDIY